jgi:hypothetical protein
MYAMTYCADDDDIEQYYPITVLSNTRHHFYPGYQAIKFIRHTPAGVNDHSGTCIPLDRMPRPMHAVLAGPCMSLHT